MVGNLKRVKVFSDWEYDSLTNVNYLARATTEMKDNVYRNIEFVDSDYDYAIVFNYPQEPIYCVEENVIGMLMEPPEILDQLYQNRPIGKVPGVGKMFSFCFGTEYEAAPGLAFSLVVPFVTNNRYHRRKVDTKPAIMMICSDKEMTPWQVKRRQVFKALLETDFDIDFYGRFMSEEDPRCKGTIPRLGKEKIFKNYDICIDFENSEYGAITDKFYDPVLCNVFPVSNAKQLLAHVLPESFFLIDWDLTVPEIVEKIKEITECSYKELNYRYPFLMSVKQDILCGDMNMINWIWKKVTEMDLEEIECNNLKVLIRSESGSDHYVVHEILDGMDSYGIEGRPNNIIVDIGANIGIFTVYAATLNADSKIISYEPEDENFLILGKNIHLSGIEDRVEIRKIAISDSIGDIYLDGNSGLTKTSKESGSQKVSCITLDELFKIHNLTEVDILKVDIEGGEYDMFKNVSDNVLKVIKYIAMEVHWPTQETISILFKALEKFHYVNFVPTEGDPTGSGMMYAELRPL